MIVHSKSVKNGAKRPCILKYIKFMAEQKYKITDTKKSTDLIGKNMG